MNTRADRAAKVLARRVTHALLCLAGALGGVVSTSAQVQQAWAARYTNGAAYAVKLDSLSNVYVAGFLRGTNGLSDYATIKYDANGNQLWLAHYDGPDHLNDYAYALALDAAGNVYVTGDSQGGYATVKYDGDGNQRWAARYNGGNSGGGVAVAVDSMGNVYVTGYSSGDYATVKYDADGTQQWVRRYDGPAGGNDVAVAVAVDSADNVYVTGGSAADSACVICLYDYATVKYDPSGNQLRVARYHQSGFQGVEASAIAVDSAGNVYVTGGGDEYVTIKHNTDGDEMWAAHYKDPNGFAAAEALALDKAGNVYVTGVTDSTGTNTDYATIKYDANGNQLWVARYDGPDGGYDNAQSVALDGSGNVYVSGWSVRSDGSQDEATIKYDSNGNRLWDVRYSNGLAYGLAVDAASNVYVTGSATVKYVQTLAGPRLISPMLLSTGEFRFAVLGETGRSYTIQASTNFLNWIALTNFVSAAGTNEFTDTAAPSFNRRFYRAMTP